MWRSGEDDSEGDGEVESTSVTLTSNRPCHAAKSLSMLQYAVFVQAFWVVCFSAIPRPVGYLWVRFAFCTKTTWVFLKTVDLTKEQNVTVPYSVF